MKRAVAPPRLPALRAPLVFGALLALFTLLLVRSLYLQRVDNAFLQEQGSSRHSRDIELPAHRGRILDRLGEPLAISTPVKAVWAWPEKIDATPEQLRALAGALGMPATALIQKISAAGDFVYLMRPVAPDVAERVAALQIKGVHDETEYWRYYPGGEVMSQILGFTGDHDVGQEGMELAQQPWLGGKPGRRRVIINRRGEILEDVVNIRAPQEGRDLALAVDSRLQYLAFRELKAAIDAKQGEGRRHRHSRCQDR
jgi:cell division protein FtsI (penicillin-binding protein 3)